MRPELGIEHFRHLADHGLERGHGDLVLVMVQDLDEAGHVCALEHVRQPDVHVEVRHRVLLAAGPVAHDDRMLDVLDPDTGRWRCGGCPRCPGCRGSRPRGLRVCSWLSCSWGSGPRFGSHGAGGVIRAGLENSRRFSNARPARRHRRTRGSVPRTGVNTRRAADGFNPTRPREITQRSRSTMYAAMPRSVSAAGPSGSRLAIASAHSSRAVCFAASMPRDVRIRRLVADAVRPLRFADDGGFSLHVEDVVLDLECEPDAARVPVEARARCHRRRRRSRGSRAAHSPGSGHPSCARACAPGLRG